MITLTDHWPHFLYLVFVALAVAAERYWLYEVFVQKELIRRGMGIVTVVVPAIALATVSTTAEMWVIILAGFLVAGGIKVFLDAWLEGADDWRQQIQQTVERSGFNECS